MPQDGYYDINVCRRPRRGVTLSARRRAGTADGPTAGGLWSNQGPISLTAGALVPITLTATSIKTTFSVSWQSQGPGWQLIPAQYLYPLNLVTRLGDTYVRFLKATSLATDLSLTATETRLPGHRHQLHGEHHRARRSIALGSAVFTPRR